MQDQKKPYLICFDIDGTILSEDTGIISDSTIDAIQRAKANGHLVFINTGRTIFCLEDTIKDIGFDGYICGCGTYIEYQGQVLFYQTLDKEFAKELITDINDYNMEVLLEGRNGLYMSDRCLQERTFETYKNNQKKPPFQAKSWKESNFSFDKLFIFQSDHPHFEQFQKKYSPYFEFIDRGTGSYEVVPTGFSKATGMQFLMDHLEIPHDHTMVFGDSNNDISMLEFAKISIAMGNCTPSLQTMVSYVTKSVDNCGIEYALKHFSIIN